MTTGVTVAGAVAGSFGWTFDANFWITSESVNGAAVNFAYDNDGRLKSAGDMTITRNGQNGFLTGTALVNASVAIADSYAGSSRKCVRDLWQWQLRHAVIEVADIVLR